MLQHIKDLPITSQSKHSLLEVYEHVKCKARYFDQPVLSFPQYSQTTTLKEFFATFRKKDPLEFTTNLTPEVIVPTQFQVKFCLVLLPGNRPYSFSAGMKITLLMFFPFHVGESRLSSGHLLNFISDKVNRLLESLSNEDISQSFNYSHGMIQSSLKAF